jgi:hypothetical protein
MAHNVTIVKPRAREDIGKKADAMPAVPDRQGRLFVLEGKRILAATAMVEPERMRRWFRVPDAAFGAVA